MRALAAIGNVVNRLSPSRGEHAALIYAATLNYTYYVCINDAWLLNSTPKKAAANQRKHGVSFADAEPVFSDDMALTREDANASGEACFVTVGADALGRILTVCWTERGQAVRYDFGAVGYDK